MEKNEIISELVKNGAVQVENLIVKDVCVEHSTGDITRSYVTIRVASDDLNAIDADGKDTKVNYCVMSFISVLGGLGDILKPSIKRHIKQNPFALEDLLYGANIKVLQQKVEKDTVYTNPFSENAKASEPLQKTKFFSHLIDCEFGKDGKELMREIRNYRNFGAGLIASL